MTFPPTPPDPYERYRVERAEADRKSKRDSEPQHEAQHSSFALGAHLLHLFYKFLGFFEDTSEKGLSTTAEEAVRNNLLSIKESFEVLKREDRSQDGLFLNRLSTLWHKALEDLVRFRKETALAVQFKSFIKEIDHYPESEEFTFGYYLLEYAGQKWLPFPYMELVQKIHDQHQKNPDSSALTRWTRLIDDLAKKLEPPL